MAAEFGKSKQQPSQRALEYRRMRIIAGGLLALMLAVFVAASLGQSRWPELSYVRAFAEAAMVGAIADWFAVVALFRRPFGLPIPHTAIIPRNKDRIGESLGAFICNNFLAPDVVAAKLDSLDVAGRVTSWLGEEKSAEALARRASAILPALLNALDDDNVRQIVRSSMSRGLHSLEAAPLVARILSVLVAHGHHQALFDRCLDMTAEWLLDNEGSLRAKVADRSWKWMPRWMDDRLGDKVVIGMLDTLAELRDPAHPWRFRFQMALEQLIHRLAYDPALLARGEAIKAEVMKNPLVEEYLDSLWSETRARLRQDLTAGEGVLRAGLERALASLAGRLRGDEHLRTLLNRWLRRVAERNVVPHRGEIGNFIAGVVARWDTRTLVDKLELQVGKDLQYIRINGTVVGGLVGLIIHAVSRVLG